LIHDLSFEDPAYLQTFSPSLLADLTRWTPRAIAESDHLVAVSEFTKQQIVRFHNIALNDISVVHHGVDHQDAARAEGWSRDTRRLLGFAGPYIAHVSVLQPRKNIIRLLDAWERSQAHLQEFHLVLAGSRGWLDEPILKRVSELPRTKYVGRLSRQDLWGFIAGSELLVMLGSGEGFGLPAIEGWAVGRPVVRADSGALPELWDDPRLVVEPSSTDAVAQALVTGVTLAGDPDYQNEMRQHAATFTWEKAAGKVLDAIELAFERAR
jgi:alpha-1,3-rhamnosyl/mannosyltransferase